MAACKKAGDPQPSASVEPSDSPEPSASPSEEPSAAPSEEPAPSNEPAPSDAALAKKYAGTYDFYAWDLYDGSMYTEIAGHKYILTETTLDYTIDGVSQGVWNIRFDPYTADDGLGDAIITLSGPSEDVWYAKTAEDGTLSFYSVGTYVFYYVTAYNGEETPAPSEKPSTAPSAEPSAAPSKEPTPAPSEEPTPAPAEKPTPAPSEEPTPAPSEEPSPAPSEEPTPAPSEEPVKAAHPYVGTYDLYAWCLYDFTSYTEVKDSKYIITDNTLEYTVGGVSQGVWNIKVEPHTADDTADHVITLSGPSSDVWYVKTQEDGTVLMYDSGLYIFYYVRLMK
ncbi:MAG: hypothetical protein PUB51_03805, partial [Oscillospiraceae bacterium]|nr:hypothetical protein [Oscillospiraceae bacterium]